MSGGTKVCPSSSLPTALPTAVNRQPRLGPCLLAPRHKPPPQQKRRSDHPTPYVGGGRIYQPCTSKSVNTSKVIDVHKKNILGRKKSVFEPHILERLRLLVMQYFLCWRSGKMYIQPQQFALKHCPGFALHPAIIFNNHELD